MLQPSPNPWGYFGKVYVCTLERSMDRHKWMTGQFEMLHNMGYDVEYEFVVGAYT